MGDIDLPNPLDPAVENLCNHIVIGIPDELKITFGSEECIYRVPATLRNLNEAAYTPRMISIGPIHHDAKHLKAMEVQKLRYLKAFCNRLGLLTEEQRNSFLRRILSTIKKDHEKNDICRHYAADFSELLNDHDQFVKMILMDAVFIFELFLRNEEYVRRENNYQEDFIIGKPWLRAAIQRDLILLENQLPFTILEKLYNHANNTTGTNGSSSFLQLSCLYFKKYDKKKSKPTETLHFTDLVRYFLCVKHPEVKSPSVKRIKHIYSATMLQQAGIRFKAKAGESLLDIRAWNSAPDGRGGSVKKGELHMPPLEINNNTECLFRNLMALEQCHYPGKEYICRYVKLLDFLVDIEKDVDLLIESGVIVSKLGDSEAVAKLINRLCREMVEVPSSYDPLCKLLNDYYESLWNKNKAYFSSVYFQNVWIGTGTVVGFLILAITVTRFILSFFHY